MFWIKKKNLNSDDGYLYLRETIYIRDKRTRQKKPKKLGSNTSLKTKNKYTKKKDIYCGKIRKKEPTKLLSFKEYITKTKKIDFLEYKINSAFDELLEDFIDYLLYIHNIQKEEFYSKKKKTYALANGYLSPITIDWLKRFNLKTDPQNPKEIERFALRAQDIGIYDEEIISSLYMKLSSNILNLNSSEDKYSKLEKISYKNMKSFIKNSS